MDIGFSWLAFSSDRQEKANSHHNCLCLYSLFTIFSVLLFTLPLSAIAQDSIIDKDPVILKNNSDYPRSNKTSTEKNQSLETMNDQSMRTVTGDESLTFDTIAIDGEIPNPIPTLTDENNSDENNFGLFLYPVALNNLVVGEGEVITQPGDNGNGNSSDATIIRPGPIRGGASIGTVFGTSPGSSGLGQLLGSQGGSGLDGITGNPLDQVFGSPGRFDLGGININKPQVVVRTTD